MSRSRALIVPFALLSFVGGYVARYYTSPVPTIGRSGHPAELTVTYPLPTGGEKHRERVKLRVWQIAEAGELTSVESNTDPRQWVVSVGSTSYFASPVE